MKSDTQKDQISEGFDEGGGWGEAPTTRTGTKRSAGGRCQWRERTGPTMEGGQGADDSGADGRGQALRRALQGDVHNKVYSRTGRYSK